jgi:hypothetical protein
MKKRIALYLLRFLLTEAATDKLLDLLVRELRERLPDWSHAQVAQLRVALDGLLPEKLIAAVEKAVG